MKRLTIRVDLDETRQIGIGKARLLEAIEAEGSITAAAKALGMSYRRAWLLMDELNRMFETPVVETRLGGRGGANARLTILGRAVVQLYRSIEKSSQELAAARIDELARHLRPAPSSPSRDRATAPSSARRARG